MDVLLVESHPGLGCQATHELERAGHRVVRCTDHVTAGPCAGLHDGGTCPLDEYEVAVALVARVGSELRAGEHGALCAARHRIPIVAAGDVVELGVFDSIATPAGVDLVAAVERAAQSGSAHASAVVRDLLSLGVVGREQVDGDDPALTVAVERSPRRLRMTLWLRRHDGPAADGVPGLDEDQVVKAATEALRRFDPRVPVIDVVVHR